MTTSHSEDVQQTTTSPSKDAKKMPDLRYHDESPLAKADNKRLCSALSPEGNESDPTKTVQEAFKHQYHRQCPILWKRFKINSLRKSKPPLMRALKVWQKTSRSKLRKQYFTAKKEVTWKLNVKVKGRNRTTDKGMCKKLVCLKVLQM